jgi:hypothetical protein
VAMDIANGAGANATMKTRTITKGGKSVPVEEIIKFSNKFQKDIGLLSQTRGGETIPEKKPIQKEWTMSKFGSGRFGRIVQSIYESAQTNLHEAAKRKFDSTPTIGTFRSGLKNMDDAQTYASAMKPLKTRKTDAAGNLLKTSKPIFQRDGKHQTIRFNRTPLPPKT